MTTLPVAICQRGELSFELLKEAMKIFLAKTLSPALNADTYLARVEREKS